MFYQINKLMNNTSLAELNYLIKKFVNTKQYNIKKWKATTLINTSNFILQAVMLSKAFKQTVVRTDRESTTADCKIFFYLMQSIDDFRLMNFWPNFRSSNKKNLNYQNLLEFTFLTKKNLLSKIGIR